MCGERSVAHGNHQCFHFLTTYCYSEGSSKDRSGRCHATSETAVATLAEATLTYQHVLRSGLKGPRYRLSPEATILATSRLIDAHSNVNLPKFRIPRACSLRSEFLFVSV